MLLKQISDTGNDFCFDGSTDCFLPYKPFLMHDTTRRELGCLLTLLAVKGERDALSYIKESYLKDREIPDQYVEYRDLQEFLSRLEAGEIDL